MSDFAIEPIGGGDWDLVLDAEGDFVLLGETEDTRLQEVAQRVVYALGTWLGESSFDRSVGFPWLEGVFDRAPLDGISALVYERILEVDGVDGLIDQPVLLLDTAERVLTISAKVKVGAFEVPISTTIQGPTT